MIFGISYPHFFTLAKVDSIRAIRHLRRSSEVGVSLFSFSSPKSNSLKPESGIEYGVSGTSESSFKGIEELLKRRVFQLMILALFLEWLS